MLFNQIHYVCSTKQAIVWLLRSSSIRPSFDTGGSKFGRNSDQTSTPPVSKFGRSLLGISMNYIVNLIKCLPNCDTKLRPHFDQTSTKLRPNFDQASTKLRPNFGATSFNIYYFIEQISNLFKQISYCSTTLQQNSFFIWNI